MPIDWSEPRGREKLIGPRKYLWREDTLDRLARWMGLALEKSRAGGGEDEELEHAVELAERGTPGKLDELERGTYHTMGGGLLYVARGRKPG